MNQQNENAPKTPLAGEIPAAAKSVVDSVFDTVTDWAVAGLHATQRGLEQSARFLEVRAVRLGDLATKLAARPEAHSA